MLVLLRPKQVCLARGCGKSSLYEDIKAGLFPPPIKIGRRASAWPDYEVDALNKARIAGKSDVEIRKLVERLVAGRRRSNDAGSNELQDIQRSKDPMRDGAPTNAELIAQGSAGQIGGPE